MASNRIVISLDPSLEVILNATYITCGRTNCVHNQVNIPKMKKFGCDLKHIEINPDGRCISYEKYNREKKRERWLEVWGDNGPIEKVKVDPDSNEADTP